MKSLTAVFLGVAVFAPPVLATDIPPQNQFKDPDYSILTPYYNEVSNGIITPVADDLPADYPAQDYYKIDVPRFNQSMKQDDFLEASRKFYGGLAFNTRTQKHNQLYYYMASWRTLFHPPIKQLTEAHEVYNKDFAPIDKTELKSDFFDPEFQLNLDKMSGTELTYGNELELLPNDRGYHEKLRMVKEAKRYLWATVMVFFCHPASAALGDEMIKKHKAGVDVRLMVEGLWTTALVHKCVNRFKKAGIPVVLVSTALQPKTRFGVMHHKFWIRDGEEAVIGGQNFHDYSNLSDGFNNLTRDTDARVRGPSATDLTKQYMILWTKYADEKKPSMKPFENEIEKKVASEKAAGQRGTFNYPKWLENPKTRMNGVCRVLVQRPYATSHAIAPVLRQYAEHSKSHILISSPSMGYTVLGKPSHWHDYFAKLLIDKANKDGVKVDLVSNGLHGGGGDLSSMVRQLEGQIGNPKNVFYKILKKFDELQAPPGAKKNRKPLLEISQQAPNIRGWQYFQFLHAKQQMFDRIAASIGSFNFDVHSGERNHESTMICLDNRLTDQLERQFTLDMINSAPVVSSNGK